MSRPPDHMYEVSSETLSEVMDDIGVNERLVKKRRRAQMLTENIMTIDLNQTDFRLKGVQSFIFGSQIEGSTTLGLKSDLDGLTAYHTVVIQNMSERKPEVVNLLMIQNENISPGYCYLQCIKPDLPQPGSVNDIDSQIMEHCVPDSDGRLLLNNTFFTDNHLPLSIQTQFHGPAITLSANDSVFDLVSSFYCESSPHQVTSWLQKQRGCKWPTDEVLEKCRNAGCFVVAVESKASYILELEWRISTSLQERYLMFSLNITQLRCYILMKMILKTHINPHVEDVLSSFMCKNVLWYCIANSSHDWHTGNLLSDLHLCLVRLNECVEQRNCSHFMLPENNLLAGRMTDTQRGTILNIINNLMKNDEQLLYEIQIDDLGTRLMMKLNLLSHCPNIASATLISQTISVELLKYGICNAVMIYLPDVLKFIKHESIERALPYLFPFLTELEIIGGEGDFYRRTASELLIPQVRSTLGSVLASSNIASHTAISDQAFTFLEESDALSDRLKFISVLYCTGDIERAERELRISLKHYKLPLFDGICKCNDGSACECYAKAIECTKLDINKACDDNNEEVIKSHLPLRAIFLQCEINCVPHELRYEILKSYIKEDRQPMTFGVPMLLDYIVVDSVPYLFFLQYKTYGHLQRRTEQLIALNNIERSIGDPFLMHRDTAVNLLGQCYEQENWQTKAFQFYIRSLKYRVRNNAARFLLCIQLFKLLKQYNTL